jgi:hypothetical protein
MAPLSQKLEPPKIPGRFTDNAREGLTTDGPLQKPKLHDQGDSEHAENEDDYEECDKDKEEDFCNRSRTSRDAREAQRACDDRYYQENDSPL